MYKHIHIQATVSPNLEEERPEWCFECWAGRIGCQHNLREFPGRPLLLLQVIWDEYQQLGNYERADGDEDGGEEYVDIPSGQAQCDALRVDVYVGVVSSVRIGRCLIDIRDCVVDPVFIW